MNKRLEKLRDELAEKHGIAQGRRQFIEGFDKAREIDRQEIDTLKECVMVATRDFAKVSLEAEKLMRVIEIQSAGLYEAKSFEQLTFSQIKFISDIQARAAELLNGEKL